MEVEDKNDLDLALGTVFQDEPNPDEPNPNEPNPDEPNPDEPNPDEPNPDEPNPDEPNPDEPNPDEPPKESSTIRDMRNRYSEASKSLKETNAILEKAAKLAGMTVDEYKEKLDEDLAKQEAERTGMTPEQLKAIKDKDDRIAALEEEQRQTNFIRNLTNVKNANSLDEPSLRTFVADATKAGFDLTNPNLNPDLVYKALNFNSLVDKVREETRQAVLAEIEKQGNAGPGVVQTNGGNGGKTKTNLDEALKAIKF